MFSWNQQCRCIESWLYCYNSGISGWPLTRAFRRYLNRYNQPRRSWAVIAAVPDREDTRRLCCHSRVCWAACWWENAKSLIGEQHARPVSLTSEPTTATACANRRLRLEADVSRQRRAVPGSIGEQHARPGNRTSEPATDRGSRRLPVGLVLLLSLLANACEQRLLQ